VSLHTPLCDLLGISVPVLSAPFGAAPPALVAAVSNAGGFGLYGLTWHAPSDVATAVAAVRARTDRAFGVNLVLEWDVQDRVRAALDAGVEVFSFTWGDSSALAELVHAAGGTVLHTVASAEEARRAVDGGADVVVAQAWEAGGHVRTELAAMPLVPAVCDAVGPVPVVLAGGVADGRGLAAALSLGAAGVWLGTRFLAATEARVHPDYSDRLLASGGADTVLTTAFDGGWDGQHRVLRNSTLQAWEAHGRPPSGRRPGEHDVVGHGPRGEELLRYDMTSPGVGTTGAVEAMALYAGQSVELVTDRRPAADIVAAVVQEAEAALDRAAAWRRPGRDA
jgi:NAD(P)H-dependent flavin oxidoreductase YrpB (nitropropane dioxygenase family)